MAVRVLKRNRQLAQQLLNARAFLRSCTVCHSIHLVASLLAPPGPCNNYDDSATAILTLLGLIQSVGMAHQMNRSLASLFLSAGQGYRSAEWRPSVDIYRTARGWLVKFELAGVRPDEIQLTARDRYLTLRGHRRDLRVEEGQRSYSMEISYNQFERTIELPCEVDKMDVGTDYHDGMLVVRLSLKVPDDECR